MQNPTPVRRFYRDRWIWWLDLRRPWDLGQYPVPIEATQAELAHDADDPTFPAAIHASWRILDRERRRAEAESRQLSLLEASPPVPKALDAWVAKVEADDGAPLDAYNRDVVERIKRRFPTLPVRALSGDAGDVVLLAWRDDVARKGMPGWLATKTRRNTFGVCMQFLRWAKKEGLISEVPTKPKVCLPGETLKSPRQPTVSEADVRAICERLFSGNDKLSGAGLDTPEAREWYVRDRQLYTALGLYTGMRVINLDDLRVEHVGHDTLTFLRRSHKTEHLTAAAEEAVCDLPTEAARLVEAHLRRPGRKWRPDSYLCGGPWPTGHRQLTRAAVRAGVPLPVNFRSVLRRSTVRELCLRGWSEKDAADYLGHADTTMIHQVYRVTPEKTRSSRKIPWDPAATKAELGYEYSRRASVLPVRPVQETEAPTPHRGGLRLHTGGRTDSD